MINEQKIVKNDKKPKSKNWFLILGVIFVIVAIVGAYVYSKKLSSVVKTLPVKKQELKDIIDVSGLVQSENDIIIKSVSTGIVMNRFVKENFRLKTNTPLLEIDPQQTKLQLNQAKINAISTKLLSETNLLNATKTLTDTQERHNTNVENIKKQLDKLKNNIIYLESELKRNSSLLKDGAISKQTVDSQQQQLTQAKIDLNTAINNFEKVQKDKGEILVAKNAVAQAKISLDNSIKQGNASISIANDSFQKTVVTAPFAGTITTWMINKGDLVTIGTQIAKFQDLDELRLVLPVNELDFPKIKNNNNIEITFDAYPEKKYIGKITWIGESTVADAENVKNFPVKISFPNKDHLIKPGMNGDAFVTVMTKKDVLAVPLTNIHKKDGKIFVNIYKDNKIVETEIKAGISTLDYLEVKSGLNVGDLLVTE